MSRKNRRSHKNNFHGLKIENRLALHKANGETEPIGRDFFVLEFKAHGCACTKINVIRIAIVVS